MTQTTAPGERVDRLLRTAAGALAGIGAAALAGIFVLVLVAVAMRYVWGRPFAFTEELSGLFMTLAVFTLLPSAVLQEINIRVTVVSERLPEVHRRWLFLFGQSILMVFCFVFVREAWGIYEFTDKLKLMSEQSRLPLAPFLLISTVAVAAAGVAGAWRAWHPVQAEVGKEVHA
jgi:TRAP-type C4-dicarboxylate transport system permease small subunit